MSKLTFSDVGLTYVGETMTCALSHLDLSIEAGESVAIIGPSGCGKSSTLLLAAGLEHPTSGTVAIDGQPLSGPRQQSALILQDLGLLPWKTVRNNVELGLRLRKMPRAEREQRGRDALARMDLTDYAEAYPAELSGGMRQRVAIARSLALDCDLLMMDEPLSALDALLREQLQDMLLDLWQHRGYTQIVVTHSIEEAAYLGQRIIVMTPRPGHVLCTVDNPGMGAPDYRSTAAYFELCTHLRRELGRHSEAPLPDYAEEVPCG